MAICHVCNGKEFTEDGYQCHLQTSLKHQRRLIQQQLSAKTLGSVLEETSAQTSPKSALLPTRPVHAELLQAMEVLVGLCIQGCLQHHWLDLIRSLAVSMQRYFDEKWGNSYNQWRHGQVFTMWSNLRESGRSWAGACFLATYCTGYPPTCVAASRVRASRSVLSAVQTLCLQGGDTKALSGIFKSPVLSRVQRRIRGR